MMDSAPASTQVTCTSCGQPTTVPFVPTPGRPVYCRDCFAKQRAASPGGYGGGPGGAPPRRGPMRASSYSGPREGRPPPVHGARKRMLAQGRKTHFIYDAKALMRRQEGGMDDQHHRAFLEGLFARGARDSTAAARDFLDEKLADQTVTPEEHRGLSDLIERYSFWR